MQHFGLYTKSMTLNFIHFTIQEFLAAHYISHLPSNEELKVMETNFWSHIHCNMFSMYISLTKGQRSSFKTFLSSGNKEIPIADKFLDDQLKCVCLYRCFNEVEDYIMCKTIEQAKIFKRKEICLRYTRLTASNMECISLFITSSFNKEWVELDLSYCYILDKGLRILYSGLCHSSNITIDGLDLGFNGLTTQSSSLISELTVKCKVKVLWLDGNHITGEDQQLYSMLTNSSNKLEELYMFNVKLSCKGARELFSAINDNNKLKKLDIDCNAITDDACDVITATLEKNSCLVKLSMWDNPLSSEAIMNIVQCLQVKNTTLQVLGVPGCPQVIKENTKTLQEVVNKKRESQGCQVKLKII